MTSRMPRPSRRTTDEADAEAEPEDDEADQVTTEIDLRSVERPPAPE